MPRKNIPVPVPSGSKFCHSCQTPHPLSGFGSHRGQKDGLNSQCKACARASSKRSRHLAKLVKDTAKLVRSIPAQMDPYELPVEPMSVPYP